MSSFSVARRLSYQETAHDVPMTLMPSGDITCQTLVVVAGKRCGNIPAWTLALLMGAIGPTMGWAASIELKDRTVFSGDVLQTDDHHVVFRLPREAVAIVDGQPLPPVLAPGAMAPAFSATDTTGARHVLGTETGRVTVLHFWVSWCAFCRADQPQIEALHQRFKNDPRINVLTVSLDQERSMLNQFLQERHVTYPVISAQELVASKEVDLPALYQIHAFPVTFLIDGHGVIRHKLTGSFAASEIDVGRLVEALLTISPPALSLDTQGAGHE